MNTYKGFVISEGKKKKIIISNGTDEIVFPVGKKCVKDSRDCTTGTAGTARWLTSIPAKPIYSRPRELSNLAFIREVDRLIGSARAKELLDEVGLTVKDKGKSANGSFTNPTVSN